MFDQVPYFFAVVLGSAIQAQAAPQDTFETHKAAVVARTRRQSEVMVDLYNCSMKAISPDGLAKCQALAMEKAKLLEPTPAAAPAVKK